MNSLRKIKETLEKELDYHQENKSVLYIPENTIELEVKLEGARTRLEILKQELKESEFKFEEEILHLKEKLRVKEQLLSKFN